MYPKSRKNASSTCSSDAGKAVHLKAPGAVQLLKARDPLQGRRLGSGSGAPGLRGSGILMVQLHLRDSDPNEWTPSSLSAFLERMELCDAAAAPKR